MEVEPVNININSDDECDNDIEVTIAHVNHSSQQNVNNSSAEMVYVLNSQESACNQHFNPIPPQHHSQEYAFSQDSAVTSYTMSPQMGYGWYPYSGSQSGSLTQDSGASLAYSSPMTQEVSYTYSCPDTDDASTVCESLTQDSVCSFSSICSEATTIQDFSEDMSQAGMDLHTFSQSDIGTQEYFDQAYYGNNVTPSASQQNMHVMKYSNQTNFQNQPIRPEITYSSVPQPNMGMQALPSDANGGQSVSMQNTVTCNENVDQYNTFTQQLPVMSETPASTNNGNQAGYHPTTNELNPADLSIQINPQDYNAAAAIPVVAQVEFEAAPSEAPTPALHLSEAGILSVLLKNNIAVEMTLDQAIRLVDHKQNMVAAATSLGDMSCLYHSAAKISNQQGVCEADLFWDRRAKLCPDGIFFSCGSASYMLQPRRLEAIPPDFADLSTDLSVTMLFSSSKYGPHIVPHLEEVVRQATYKYHEDGIGVTITINGVRVEQRKSGDVFVEHENKYLHLSSEKQFLHVDTPMSEMSVEKDWLVKVKYRGLNLICGTKGMTLSDGAFDCGFNPYHRSFLRPAYMNVQTIILDGVSISSDFQRRWMSKRRNNNLQGRRPFHRRPEPDYSGRVQGLEQIIRRKDEPDEEYYARLKAYRDMTEGEARQEDQVVSFTRKVERGEEHHVISKEVGEVMKGDVATNDIGAAGDNIAHV